MHSYIALIHKEPESDFGVSFPDFPGCVTAGSTLEQAQDEAADALALHLDGMREDGETIPTPTSLDRVLADPSNRNAMAFLVPLPLQLAGAARISITFPQDVLDDVDRAASREGLSRSAFIANAARRAATGRA